MGAEDVSICVVILDGLLPPHPDGVDDEEADGTEKNMMTIHAEPARPAF